jgi:acetyl esterase/lipase
MKRRTALLAASLTAALAVVAWLGVSTDTSPLARLEKPWAAARDVAYGAGEHQRLDIVYDRTLSRPRPAVVMIHQGGWTQGDKSAYHGWMAPFARSGYVTVSVNFRPSGVDRYPAAVDDCELALRWLRDHATSYGVDPARIGVTGWSSGAHLAMMLALRGNEVKAAVCVSGVYDFLMEAAGAFPNREDDPAVVRFLGVSPRENPELARRASPLTHLSPGDPPLLVFHGELDPRIDVEQARHFARASKALGRRDDVVPLPGEGHGRDVFPGDPDSRRRVREFFAKHLRPGD